MERRLRLNVRIDLAMAPDADVRAIVDEALVEALSIYRQSEGAAEFGGSVRAPHFTAVVICTATVPVDPVAANTEGMTKQ